MPADPARIDSAVAAADSMVAFGMSAAKRSPEMRAESAAAGSAFAMHSATLAMTSSPTCIPKVSLMTCRRSMSRYRMQCVPAAPAAASRVAACRSKAWRVMSPVLESY